MKLDRKHLKDVLYGASRLNFVEHFQIYYDGNRKGIPSSMFTEDFYPISMNGIQKVEFLLSGFNAHSAIERMKQTPSLDEISYDIEFRQIQYPELDEIRTIIIASENFPCL